MVVAVLLISSWVYHIENKGFGSEVNTVLREHSTVYLCIGTLMIFVLIVVSVVVIYSMSTKNKE